MTSRERVLAAPLHEQPDRTPRDFWAELPARQRLFAYVGHTDKDKLLDALKVDVPHLEARRHCEVLGKGGGYILGPSHLFQPDVSPQNVLAAYQAAP